ncbi:HAD-IIA family hydrolase [Thermococcus thioreducens]|uniref:4-nitrophenyl phosphatase n=1 Tax=Thermococcus thioreducens TaxID=277988 RepID=A0A0Q2QPN3_9EURY|nr:HAD-IIA family hydrolase [Thermococcus thioreducens]ASJ11565.1 HAD family hydrolase [Thermococcus thioreducens]KQH81829.1 HAD family hydrolase [Thermococcus thioreducens]SEW04378.1 4-nitrophenyl phosphatase [Thermococcus thioreducens]
MLRKIGLIFDMDGVIYRGSEPIEGARELINFLKEVGIPFIFLTNNSTRDPAMYREKLLSIGIDVPEEVIVTSGLATRLYMERHFEPGNVFVIGGEGLHREMERLGWGIVGIEEARKGAWRQVRYVVVGLDPDMTYEKLKYATLAIRNGARFIGTNPDTTYPAEEGLYPGAGSIIAALKASTGKEPLIIGKPNEPAYEVARSKLDGVDEIWMVGDRLDTDILFAKRFGMKAVMVLTGVSTLKDVKETGIRPDLVLPSVRELLEYLKTLTEEAQ